jgi:hypothetical protein
MDSVETGKALELLASRLANLSGILDKAEHERGGEGLDELAATRLADDMHPLAWQVAAAASQARFYLEWLRGNDLPNAIPDVSTWAEARGVLADTREQLAAAVGAPPVAPEVRRIVLEPIGFYLDLSAPRYLEDWIAPNLYFHLTTAYAILRMKGIALGKGDFMQHIVGDLRPITAEVPA